MTEARNVELSYAIATVKMTGNYATENVIAVANAYYDFLNTSEPQPETAPA